nr:hypothetical protein [Tanacetum cinerariifolium]
MAKTNTSNVVVEAPPTPGRPIFSFSVGSRKNIPSKWDDAQKWLISGPDSPAHHPHKLGSKHSSSNGLVVKVKQQHLEHHGKTATDEKVCKAISVFQVPTNNVPMNQNQDSSDVVLLKELQECHFAKLKLESPFDSVDNACNWSSREEEEEDVSKSLRHFEMNNERPKSILESKACAWQEEEKTKSQLRYQREEAKIEAWVNLQKAKAEAQSRKLEVKIQKMRFKFE